MRNIFDGSFTEEGMVSINAIFEGGFKFSTSEARNITVLLKYVEMIID